MRQLVTLPTEIAARRLAAYLVTQRIDSEAEQEGESWVVWVRDEDQLATARETLDHYRANPDDPRYEGAQRTAENLRREEAERRRKIQKNVVEMRGRWGTGGIAVARRCPLVLLMIAACVLVFLFTESGNAPLISAPLRYLLFYNPTDFFTLGLSANTFVSIRKGELWRLITPIFIHFGFMHLLFNMYWLYVIGGQVEHRRGTWFFASLVIALAVISNAAQATGSIAPFGGMSGVGYGLFGYVWMKARFDNKAGYHLDPSTVFMMLLWFGLCIAAASPGFESTLGVTIGGVANIAHAAGLFAGMALGALSLLRKA